MNLSLRRQSKVINLGKSTTNFYYLATTDNKIEACQAYLGSVGEVLAVDVLADEPPQRLDVVHRRPQRVHLARLK